MIDDNTFMKSHTDLRADNAQLKAELVKVVRERDELQNLYDAGKAVWDPVYKIVLDERDQLKAELAQAAQRETRLREALTELYALVRGECPRLLNEDSGGDAELACKIDAALEEAGYRAGLEEALNDFRERCDTKNIAITDVIGHISWLEAGLKLQP